VYFERIKNLKMTKKNLKPVRFLFKFFSLELLIKKTWKKYNKEISSSNQKSMQKEFQAGFEPTTP
jgi:hypothetical protein